MNVEQVSFVKRSDVFAGANNAYQAFADSDPPMSWGDNAKSLVRPEHVADNLAEAVEFPEYEKLDAVDLDTLNPVQREAWVVLDRLEGVPKGVLVDLES